MSVRNLNGYNLQSHLAIPKFFLAATIDLIRLGRDGIFFKRAQIDIES